MDADRSRSHSAALLVFCVFLVLSLVKHLWLAGYAHPVADDFCYAAKSRGLSLWDWSYSEWLNWNGRYASNLLMIHGPLTWSTDFLPGYRAIPIALVALTFLGCWFLLRRISHHVFTTGQELVGALVFLLLYMDLMPDLGEGFYWYTGAVTYQLGNVLLLVHLALLSGGPRKGLVNVLIPLLDAVLVIIIVGMDEVHMLLMVCLHVGLLAWSVRKRARTFQGLLLLGAVGCGATLMYMAPGNAVRGAMFADTHRLLPSLGMSALQAVRFIGLWVLSPALLAVSVLYIPVHRLLKECLPAFGAMLRLSPWIAAVVPMLLVMACTFPSYWTTDSLWQHRTANVACLLFIPLWFLNLSLWLERPLLRNLARMRPTPGLLGAAMLLALLGLNLTRNGLAASIDLFGSRAAHYDHVMLKREAEVRAAAMDPTASVTFTRLADPPLTLPNYEDQRPLRGWMMDCEARFFGAKERQVEQH